MTFDLEEWYHILDLPAGSSLCGSERISVHTEKSMERFLDLLNLYGVTCTFFILGKLAEQNPHVVSRIHSANHEIASHGYNHDLITSLRPEQFREDIRRAKSILEDITGRPLVDTGPGFSITADNLWAFDVIAEEGYRYDATVYPGNHGHGVYRECRMFLFF
jgi:polysaccharide deacetylase family protein (PEP-CTERM system associated)